MDYHHQQQLASGVDSHPHPHPQTLAPLHPLTPHQLHQLQTLVVTAEDSTSSRWTQYQQLWKQHHLQVNGKAGKGGSSSSDEGKKDEGELWCNVEAQAAFLGPTLWDKTLPYDADLKVTTENYVDLDEFLSENGIPVDGMGVSGLHLQQQHQQQLHVKQQTVPTVSKRERSPSPCDPESPDSMGPPSPTDSTLSMASSRDFDPRTRTFSDEDLKPLMMVKKSRKQFVPDDLKDEKYWARRRKNNMAAKRSRDARRVKENQIALRAGFLEKENMGLRQEMDRLKKENGHLRDKLSKYGDI